MSVVAGVLGLVLIILAGALGLLVVSLASAALIPIGVLVMPALMVLLVVLLKLCVPRSGRKAPLFTPERGRAPSRSTARPSCSGPGERSAA